MLSSVSFFAILSNFGGPDLLLLVLAFMTLVLPLWMLVDCLIHDRNKVLWAAVILFLLWVGATIYYFARRSPRIHRKVG